MFADSRSLWWSWSLGLLERSITNIDHGTLVVNLSPAKRMNLFPAKGVLVIRCYWSQVSNPSIQFMLYEAMLAKLKKRRSQSKNSKGVTALEVFSHFTSVDEMACE